MLKRTLLIAVLLAPLAAPVAAACLEEHKVSSCAEGYTWDQDTGTCVEQTVG
ncbi:hypothetical protein [Celeribacter sp. ULVN23_4]